MTTEQLLELMDNTYAKVVKRVDGIGDHNYVDRFNDGSEIQAFEEKTPIQIMKDIEEEIQDAIAYLMFLGIRIQKIKNLMRVNDDNL